MNDSEIHKGLEDEEIRNAVSNGLHDSTFNKLDIENAPYPHGDQVEAILWRIQNEKNIIKTAEFNIKQASKQLAMVTLMEEMDWEEHDISQYIPKVGKFWHSFIGTTPEYHDLIKSLED